MDLLLIGISHKTAPLEVRERFAIPESRIPGALQILAGEPEVDEALIISTCNRVEFVMSLHDGEDGVAVFRRFFQKTYSLSYDDFAHCFYTHRNDEAVRHLFRVASGLDSMVVGEPQVLGQVKKAYSLAKEGGAARHTLDAVFSRVFNVAKRIRTETHVAEASVSVSSAAVEWAEQVFGDLHGKTVMIIGAGQMGELAARHLVSKGAATVLVSNRTYDHAVKLAEELKGLAVRFSEIWEAMKRADIVISSTGCPHAIITRADMESLMASRGNRPLFLVDIAVPRDIDPGVGEIPGCTLANIDALKEVTRHNLRQREEAGAAADRIVEEELAAFRERQEALRVAPTIVSLRQRVEAIRRGELARTRALFGELTPEQEEALDLVTQSLVNKILHTPFTELKQAAARPDRSQFLSVVRSIFRLEEDRAASPASAN
ncbi:MAG: glutamyl-tRNA reductase [Terriglobia bacterium]